MEKAFEKLTLNSNTNSKKFLFASSKDFVEVEIINSTKSKDDWSNTNEKISYYLPILDKFCDLVNNDSACNLNEDLLKIFYNSSTSTLLLPENLNLYYENFILIILGVFNKENFSNEKFRNAFNVENYDNVTNLENETSFLNYILRNIENLKTNLKPNDTHKLKKILDKMGIAIEKNIYDVIEKKILNDKKILVVITAGDNFWFKSDKTLIKNTEYFFMLNNYVAIYMNTNFIEKFFLRIASHPRCSLGIMSSKTKKNLDKIFENMKKCEFKSKLNIEADYLFDQEANEITPSWRVKEEKIFRRSIAKIEEKTKNNFSVHNTVFIESEIEKSELVKSNVIHLNCFNEKYLMDTENNKQKMDDYADYVLEYLEKMLNECDCEVREYLCKNPIKLFDN